ncbi:MAG: hypothetical protein Q4C13_03600, partial [Clostridia bacterium]|nr:hypothetical protein [Clostridia bacterium]
MAICGQCGSMVPESHVFCGSCGAMQSGPPLGAEPRPDGAPASDTARAWQPPAFIEAVPAAGVSAADAASRLREAPPRGSRYAVLSAWGYFGALLLLSLPLAGWILAIIWACGGAHNESLRRLARGVL